MTSRPSLTSLKKKLRSLSFKSIKSFESDDLKAIVIEMLRERNDRGTALIAAAVILRNPVYIGEVQHKGERFPGEHDAILECDLWEAVKTRLDAQRVARRVASNAASSSPLAGMLFDSTGTPMSPSHASKGSARIRYRYYVSRPLAQGLAADHPDGWRLPAEPVEQSVRTALADLLRDRSRIGLALGKAGSAARQQHLLAGISTLAEIAKGADGTALKGLLVKFDARIEIAEDSLTLSISLDKLAQEIDADIDAGMQGQRLTQTRPLVVRKRGVETRLILGGLERANPDAALIRLVADARIWMQRLQREEFPSIRALARDLGLDHRHVTRSLPLAFLSPDIVAAIVEGRQPDELTVTALKSIDTLPIYWEDQRRLLGFAAG